MATTPDTPRTIDDARAEAADRAAQPGYVSWLSSAGCTTNGGIRPPGTEGMKSSRGSGRGGVIGVPIKKASPYVSAAGQAAMKADHSAQPISRGRLNRKPAHNPGAPTSTPPEPTVREGGFYVLDDVIYRVRRSGRGFLYALSHNRKTRTWDMARGMIKKLTPAMAITFEQACAYGVESHHCLICGKSLTNPESIELGIGPICRAKMGWAPAATPESTPEPTTKELSEMVNEFEPGAPVWIASGSSAPMLAGTFVGVADNGRYDVDYVGMKMNVRPDRVTARSTKTRLIEVNPDDVISGAVKTGPAIKSDGRIDHSACTHPRTPKARAACRASRKG